MAVNNDGAAGVVGDDGVVSDPDKGVGLTAPAPSSRVNCKLMSKSPCNVVLSRTMRAACPCRSPTKDAMRTALATSTVPKESGAILMAPRGNGGALGPAAPKEIVRWLTVGGVWSG